MTAPKPPAARSGPDPTSPTSTRRFAGSARTAPRRSPRSRAGSSWPRPSLSRHRSGCSRPRLRPPPYRRPRPPHPPAALRERPFPPWNPLSPLGTPERYRTRRIRARGKGRPVWERPWNGAGTTRSPFAGLANPGDDPLTLTASAHRRRSGAPVRRPPHPGQELRGDLGPSSASPRIGDGTRRWTPARAPPDPRQGSTRAPRSPAPSRSAAATPSSRASGLGPLTRRWRAPWSSPAPATTPTTRGPPGLRPVAGQGGDRPAQGHGAPREAARARRPPTAGPSVNVNIIQLPSVQNLLRAVLGALRAPPSGPGGRSSPPCALPSSGPAGATGGPPGTAGDRDAAGAVGRGRLRWVTPPTSRYGQRDDRHAGRELSDALDMVHVDGELNFTVAAGWVKVWTATPPGGARSKTAGAHQPHVSSTGPIAQGTRCGRAGGRGRPLRPPPGTPVARGLEDVSSSSSRSRAACSKHELDRCRSTPREVWRGRPRHRFRRPDRLGQRQPRSNGATARRADRADDGNPRVCLPCAPRVVEGAAGWTRRRPSCLEGD